MPERPNLITFYQFALPFNKIGQKKLPYFLRKIPCLLASIGYDGVVPLIGGFGDWATPR